MAKRKKASPARKTVAKRTKAPTPKAVRGTVGHDVADKRAEAQPAAYVDRYQVSLDEGGRVVPRDEDAQAMPMLAKMQATVNADGTATVEIPTLAVGSSKTYIDPFDETRPADSRYYAQYTRMLQDRDGKGPMRMSRKFWEDEPIVFKCGKLLSQLANTRMTVSCSNDDVREQVQAWLELAMPASFRKAFFTEYFRSSFVPVLKTLVPYESRNYKVNKKPKDFDEEGNNVQNVSPVKAKAQPKRITAKAQQAAWEEYRDALTIYENARHAHEQNLCSDRRLVLLQTAATEKQYTWLRGTVPGAYTILDPMAVDIEGPKEMSWLREPFLNIGEALRDAIQSPSPMQAPLVEKLPAEIVAQVRAGHSKIWLSPNICQVITGEKQPYEKYPQPIAWRARDAVTMKQDLLSMDRATITGVRDRILVATIGNDLFPVLKGDGQLVALQAAFNSQHRNLTLFWNHTLTLKWVEPLHESMDTKKYEYWDNQIRTAWGITKTLTGTSDSSGAIGNNLMNFKGVEEEVCEAQDAYLEFVHKELRMFRAALGISADVRVAFDRLNLKDEVKFRGMLQQAVINGIIDHQTAIETMGYHFPEIAERMKAIKKLQKKDEIFMPIASANNASASGIPTGGKPANDPTADNNDNKKGTSQPKLAAARIVPISDNRAVLVLATATVDDETRAATAEAMNIPATWVLGMDEFTAQYGDITNVAVWPEPTAMELTGAICKAQAAWQAAEPTIKARAKAELAPGQKYLTQKRREAMHQTVLSELLTDALTDVLGDTPDLPASWDARCGEAAAAALLCYPADGPDADSIAQLAGVRVCAQQLHKVQTALEADVEVS
jgi:hypothetical protein